MNTLNSSITVWIVRESEYEHERVAMYDILKQINQVKQEIPILTAEKWHVLCNVIIGGHEIDMALFTPKVFISIELKQVSVYASVIATQNQWFKVNKKDKTELPFEGSPFEQALIQRRVMRKWATNTFKGKGAKKDDLNGILSVHATIVIAPQISDSRIKDSYDDATNSHLSICRINDFSKTLRGLILKSNGSGINADDLENAIHKKLGMLKASWKNGVPCPQNIPPSPICEKKLTTGDIEELQKTKELLSKKEEEIAQQQQQSNVLQKQKKTIENENIQLRKELQELKTAIIEKNGDLQEKNKEIQSKNKLLADTRQELNFSKENVRLLEESKTATAFELSQLKKACHSLENQSKTLELQCSKLTSERKNALELFRETQRRYETLIDEQNLKKAEEHQQLLQKIIPQNELNLSEDTLLDLPAASLVSGFISSAIWDKVDPEESVLLEWAKSLSAFTVRSDYSLDETFPIPAPYEKLDEDDGLIVLDSILSRGAPTLLSPKLEQRLAKATQLIEDISDETSLLFKLKNPEDDEGISKCIEAIALANFQTSQCELWKTERSKYQLFYQPLLTARIQKTFLTAFRLGCLPNDGRTIRILAIEHDVTGVAWALDDLEALFRNYIELLDVPTFTLPHFEIETLALDPADDVFYEGVKRLTHEEVLSKNQTDYDIVLDTAFFNRTSDIIKQFNASVRLQISSTTKLVENRLKTGGNLRYKTLVTRQQDGLYKEIASSTTHLKYFLHLLFRKKDFRPGQLPILNRALQLKPVIGLLPTGGGKSLTYQLAAMLQPGVCLVVDPLKTLMYDQVAGLKSFGIECCTEMNSDLSQSEVSLRLGQLRKGFYKFIFIAPERLQIPSFRHQLFSMRAVKTWFSYGVIDEVHCVSEWGHDFRTAYLHLGRNLYKYVATKSEERLPLFGLTATASFDVLTDVERTLSGEQAYQLDSDTIVRYEHTNRLELQYVIEPVKNGWCDYDNKAWDLKRQQAVALRNVKARAKILQDFQREINLNRIYERFVDRENISKNSVRYQDVYTQDIRLPLQQELFPPKVWDGTMMSYPSTALFFCPTAKNPRNSVYQLRDELRLEYKDKYPTEDIEAFASSAPDKYKNEVEKNNEKQHRFKQNKICFLVATKAFGMGLDKPNIRLVTNLCYPQSLEDFVQLAGRAGRDRKMALCVVLYSEKESIDLNINEYFHKTAFKGEDREIVATAYLLTALPTEGVFYIPLEDGNREYLRLADVIKRGKACRLCLNLEKFKGWSGSKIVNEIWEKYDRKHPEKRPSEKDQWKLQQLLNERQVIDTDLVKKIIFRFSLIGLVDDVQEDYNKGCLILNITPQPDGGYYQATQDFLTRYYMPESARNLLAEWKKNPKRKSELLNCIEHITEFIYAKIAKKRARAILDVQDFCKCGLNSQSGKDIFERNESLKDYLYYYFNSKYARSGYLNEREEPYSLYDDTDGAKRFDIDTIWKYMTVAGTESSHSESPIDNLKHLQGAVRLLRRSVTDINPTLALLEVFCTLMLSPPTDKEQEKRLLNSLLNDGFLEFIKLLNSLQSFEMIKTFFDKLQQYHVKTDNDTFARLKMMTLSELFNYLWENKIEKAISSILPFQLS